MSDIEKAYLCEQEYKKHEKHDDVQLVDLVRTCGFETLHDYFQAKNEYLISLKNMQIVHYQIDAGLAAMKVCDSKKGSGAFAIDEECTWAWVGSKDFNDELAISIGVRPYHLPYHGGTIITCNKDFNLALMLNREIEMTSTEYYLTKMNSFLNRIGYDTTIDNNDIIWNGNKIAGSAFYQTPNSNIFYMSLCLVDHSHEIEILCGKNTKVPGYLTGITKIEIENEVNAWLRPTI